MDKKKYSFIAIIAALSIHAIALLVMNILPAGEAPPEKSPYLEVGMFEIPEEPEIMPTLEEIIAARINEQVANLVADASMERSNDRQSSMSRSERARMESDVESDLRALEQSVKDELEAERNQNPSEEVKKKKTDSKIKDLDQYEYYGKSYNGQVTAEFDLKGREGRFIHIPGYKCKAGGTVKVTIEVSQDGTVVSAVVDEAKSSYTDSCLSDEAVMSALKCRFSAKSSAPKKQVGTITYRFIPQ